MGGEGVMKRGGRLGGFRRLQEGGRGALGGSTAFNREGKVGTPLSPSEGVQGQLLGEGVQGWGGGGRTLSEESRSGELPPHP